MTAGRPSDYSPEIVALICSEIANGKSVREICRAEDMPCMTTVFRWLRDNVEFQQQYTRAREAQADYLSEELLEIADDGSNDWIERRRQDGTVEEVLNHEHIQRSKLRVDTRKWVMSKLQPKKYGDKLTSEISGPDGKPIQTEEKSAVQLAREVAYLLHLGAKGLSK